MFEAREWICNKGTGQFQGAIVTVCWKLNKIQEQPHPGFPT
jgi:hypothetical protein